MRKVGASLSKVGIALIHYKNNRERYKYVWPKLNLLKKELSSDYEVSVLDIVNQPRVIPQTTIVTMFRKFALWKLNRDWISYKRQKPRNIFIDILILLWRLLLTYINKTSENRRTTVDSFVTDKHIRAWSKLLEGEAGLLIVFEDDAVFMEDSISVIKLFLHGIKKYQNRPIYLDFAGGCSQEVLKISNLEYKSDKLRKYYLKPVTNTACCYMINDKTAGLFLENILRYPWLRLIPIDWLMNKLFILTARKNKYFCFHASPHILKHGSDSGDYKSWL
jgi:hypothetical protein